MLKAAIAHHQAGRLAEARALYDEVLSLEPNQIVALHLAGVIAYQEGNDGQAVALIGKAIALRPNYAEAHGNLGNALKRQGKLTEAVAAFHKAIELQPDFADAHNNLGTAFHDQGELKSAVAAFQRAIEIKPDYAEAYSNLGNARKKQGDLEAAVAAYQRALELKPEYAEGYYNLGIALKDQGKLELAATAYREALELRPGYAKAYGNLGNVLSDMADFEEALAAYRRARDLEPDSPEACYNLGRALMHDGMLDEAVAAFRCALALNQDYTSAYNYLGNSFQKQGDLTAALAAYERALEIEPENVTAYNNLGNLLSDQGKLDGALARYDKVLALEPDDVDAHSNLGNVLRRLGRLNEAEAAYRKALDLDPGHASAHSNLGNAFKDQGKLKEALDAYRRSLALKPDAANIHSNLLFGMNYDNRSSQTEILAETRRWNETHAVPRVTGEPTLPHVRDVNRRLRVGYVSPDFREHSVSHFLDAVIAGHDRRWFEVFCYSEVVNPDQNTARIRSLSDAWCSTVGMTDRALAERIRDDRIDILVDLAGHTGNNRLLAFAERPAPVQVTWLGYPNTTGLPAMDYRLTDAIADPEGVADAQHSETLVRLPNGFLCYAPAGDAPDLDGPPALTTGHVTFGSFNNLAKVSSEVVETWARILDRIPNSRLVIKSRPLADAGTRKRYLEMFVARGIDANRVELCAWIASKSGHLGAYARIDIGLDPFPYNGTTTTCEALWMGVPVITLSGDLHAGRVGASILTRVGHADLVAETEEAYVEKAAALANDLDRLSALRKGLRDRMRQSPLCDADGFARDIEAAYREMWRSACA